MRLPGKIDRSSGVSLLACLTIVLGMAPVPLLADGAGGGTDPVRPRLAVLSIGLGEEPLARIREALAAVVPNPEVLVLPAGVALEGKVPPASKDLAKRLVPLEKLEELRRKAGIPVLIVGSLSFPAKGAPVRSTVVLGPSRRGGRSEVLPGHRLPEDLGPVTERVEPVTTPIGPVGVLSGADLDHPEVALALVRGGARILVATPAEGSSPSARIRRSWQALATLAQVPIAVAVRPEGVDARAWILRPWLRDPGPGRPGLVATHRLGKSDAGARPTLLRPELLVVPPPAEATKSLRPSRAPLLRGLVLPERQGAATEARDSSLIPSDEMPLPASAPMPKMAPGGRGGDWGAGAAPGEVRSQPEGGDGVLGDGSKQGASGTAGRQGR